MQSSHEKCSHLCVRIFVPFHSFGYEMCLVDQKEKTEKALHIQRILTQFSDGK